MPVVAIIVPAGTYRHFDRPVQNSYKQVLVVLPLAASFSPFFPSFVLDYILLLFFFVMGSLARSTRVGEGGWGWGGRTHLLLALFI